MITTQISNYGSCRAALNAKRCHTTSEGQLGKDAEIWGSFSAAGVVAWAKAANCIYGNQKRGPVFVKPNCKAVHIYAVCPLLFQPSI